MTRKKLIKILREYLISSDEFFDCWLKSPTLATKTLEAQRDNGAEVLSPCEGDGARRSRKRGNPLTSRLRIAQQLLMRTRKFRAARHDIDASARPTKIGSNQRAKW
jgi:hypothetical protein